jgi:oxygen-independent coproporphyrinogen-3 oxidase
MPLAAKRPCQNRRIWYDAAFVAIGSALKIPWNQVVAEVAVRSWRRGERPPAGVAEAAGLYVHVPFCRSKCRYCGFYSVPVAGRGTGRLTAALLSEMERYEGVDFRTAYIGGGSPTALPVKQLAGLARRIRERFAGIEEFTVECNPGQVEVGLLAELRQTGVNRLSFGAQSFHDAELQRLGRGHCAADIGRAAESARLAGFDNLSLDLIFAIPGSTLGDWQYSVEAAVDLGVQHISAYSLSFEPGTPFDSLRKAGCLCPVDEDMDRAMYEGAIEWLERAGLVQYEISNFARPGFECRHNLGYWANRPFVGIGPGAASYWQSMRTANDPDIERYVAAMESGLEAPGEVQLVSADDVVCETAVLNLRTRAGIHLGEFRHRTGRDVMPTFAQPVQRYRRMGLIEVAGGFVRLTRRALPIADTILCDFAALE